MSRQWAHERHINKITQFAYVMAVLTAYTVSPRLPRPLGMIVPPALTCDHTLPPLYSDAVKEGMIHLLVGSYVKKPDSGVFSDWSRNNAYETLHSYWLSYFNLISGQKVGRVFRCVSWSPEKFLLRFPESRTDRVLTVGTNLFTWRHFVCSADGFRERCWSVWKMIESDDTNKLIVTVLQIVNCPQSWVSQ